MWFVFMYVKILYNISVNQSCFFILFKFVFIKIMYIIWHRTPLGDKNKLCFNQLHLDVHKTKNKLTKLLLVSLGFFSRKIFTLWMCIILPDILPRSNEFINFKYLEGPFSTLFLTIIIGVYKYEISC